MHRLIEYAIPLFIICMSSLGATGQNISGSDTEVTECESKRCFAIKFKTCDPASYTVVTRMGTANYEILGKAENGCKVKLIYLSNPNPKWENKPLICVYDNSLDFKEAAQKALISAMQRTDESNCQGDLLKMF